MSSTVGAVAASVVAVIVVGGILLLRPWQHQAPPSPAAQPSPPSLIPASPLPPPPITTTTQPPPPPTFSARAIDQVLLTADRLTRILGIAVTDDPAGGGAGGLAIDSSSYGTGDHASQVTPQSCVGVVYTGEHEVYATAGAPDIKTQTFGHLYSGADGPHLVQQTAAVFATAEAARAFLDTS